MKHDDSGMTMVELIIYAFVSALFLGLLAMLLVNGLKAQAQTTDRDSATGTSNVAIATLTGSIRNAADLRVDADGLGLVAKVAVGMDAWQCRAWAVRDGALRYRTASNLLDTADAVSDDWGIVASGVTATLPGGAAFSDSGARQVDVGITVTTGDTTVIAASGVTAQAVSDGTDTTSCW